MRRVWGPPARTAPFFSAAHAFPERRTVSTLLPPCGALPFLQEPFEPALQVSLSAQRVDAPPPFSCPCTGAQPGKSPEAGMSVMP